jgi:Tol biopolymer transport system component
VRVTGKGGYTAIESPDGAALYYTKARSETKLWKSGLDGSGETEVADDIAMRGFAFTADRIYYLRREPRGATGLRSLTLATGKDSLIASIPKPLHLCLSVSPDGKYAAYSQVDQQGSDLMLVEDFR